MQLPDLPIKWASTKIEEHIVWHEPIGEQTIISLKDLDKVINIFDVAIPKWISNDKYATQEEYLQWLSGKKTDDNIELDFHINSNYPIAFTTEAELDDSVQWSLILTLDHTKKYWILASFENAEHSGFIIHGVLVNDKIEMELAFPILMFVFFKNYLNWGETDLYIDRVYDFTILSELEPGFYDSAVQFYLKNK